MCLKKNKTFLEKIFGVRFKTAKKDIKVYKVFEVESEGILRTPFRKTIYEYGVEIEVKLRPLINCKHFVLSDNGFHSYTNVEEAIKLRNNIRYMYRDFTVTELIIPKGAKYLIGEGNEVVSNKIKLVRD